MRRRAAVVAGLGGGSFQGGILRGGGGYILHLPQSGLCQGTERKWKLEGGRRAWEQKGAEDRAQDHFWSESRF